MHTVFIIAPIDVYYSRLPAVFQAPMVFFRDAIEHILRAARVFRQPGGHMLMVSSGEFYIRQSHILFTCGKIAPFFWLLYFIFGVSFQCKMGILVQYGCE